MTRKKLTVILLIIAAGCILVALPDRDARLFSISEEHGPSIIDSVGLALILVPYGVLVCSAWRRRDRLLEKYSVSILYIGLLLYAAGMIWVIISVAGNYGNWWIAGAALMLILQIPVFYHTRK